MIAPMNPSTHAINAINSRTTPRKNAKSVERATTRRTVQSNVVMSVDQPALRIHSLSIRGVLHVAWSGSLRWPLRPVIGERLLFDGSNNAALAFRLQTVPRGDRCFARGVRANAHAPERAL